jgi:hypothetical protein
MKTPPRERRAAALACGLIALDYAVFGLAVLEPDAIYSGDIGVKLVQARALASNRWASLDLDYPGEALDPRLLRTEQGRRGGRPGCAHRFARHRRRG